MNALVPGHFQQLVQAQAALNAVPPALRCHIDSGGGIPDDYPPIPDGYLGAYQNEINQSFNKYKNSAFPCDPKALGQSFGGATQQ